MSPKPFKLRDNCRAGHLLTEENTYTESGRLRCRDCLRARKPLKGAYKKEFCVSGHERNLENVNEHGQCKPCARDRMRDRREAGLDPKYSGVGAGGLNKVKTHCPQGHEYTKVNTYINNGKRHCRTCARENANVQVIKKYGISAEDFDRIFQVQNGLCAICKTSLLAINKREMQIDHDHSCCPELPACGDCVRGILCGECNRGLERFKDSTIILQSAIDYL